MERRKRSANQEPVIVLDEEERMEPIDKLLKLDDRDKFKTIQSEMKTKGLVLSQTWSDLYSLMSKYQAELITREDQLIDIESQIDAQRKSAKDNELERMKLQIEAKDREIKLKSKLLAETQNELGRVKSVLRSKDELIRRLQCQVKVDGDSVMTGDSPAALSEQVSMKTTITTLTISSPAGIDTSSLLTDQKHSEHVQTNFSRSGSDDSGTGAEKTDAKYQVSSSNDEETDSFLVLESDVATINIPGQESGVLEEVQPGTSVTDGAGQCLPRILINSVTSLSNEPKPPAPSANWPVLHYLLTKERSSRSSNGPTALNIPTVVSSQVVPVGDPIPGPGVLSAQMVPNSQRSTDVQGRLPRAFEGQEPSRSDVRVKVEPVDEEELSSPDVPDQQVDHSMTSRIPEPANSIRTETHSTIKTETEIHMCGSCGVDLSDAETLLKHSRWCDGSGMFDSQASGEFLCRVCRVTFGSAVELLSHLNTHR